MDTEVMDTDMTAILRQRLLVCHRPALLPTHRFLGPMARRDRVVLDRLVLLE